MKLMFGFHITRNDVGMLELWREGRNWVVTKFNHNDVDTNEMIRVGDWVCSVRRIVPYVFLVNYHYPLGCSFTEADWDF